MKKIIVGIGEGRIAIQQDILVSYALGSCIGVCLYDEARQVAGMAHIVLPHHPRGEVREKYKYADIGCNIVRRNDSCGSEKKIYCG